MARMITGMFPQPVQTDPASQSEPENSVTSDIGENVFYLNVYNCDFRFYFKFQKLPV